MSCNLCIRVKAIRNGFVDIIRRSRRARLACKNYGNHVVFQISLNFLAFFVLFRKIVVSTHKTADNKAPDQILPYSDNMLFSNKAANSCTRELLNQAVLETFLLRKQINITHAVLEFCTERFVTSASNNVRTI